MSDTKKSFDLDISGVAGFFGGDVSVSAMATVHIYEGRKWLGWYNQPGSYEIAKRYGQLSRSRFWDALYPGVDVDPAILFEFDGTQGPKFMASQSGTVLANTGHVARLFAEECKDLKPRSLPSNIPPGRTTTPGSVSVAHLSHVPSKEEEPHQERNSTSILASIPILTSLGACAGCAAIGDWYCFAIILLGIISSGFSCYMIGMGTLKFKHPEAATGAPPGDGVLELSGCSELVVLKGPEGAVTAITRGQFSLDYDSKPEYRGIGVCSMLLTVQFIAQLLLVPQASLHGQLFFLATLACAWAYNSYLSSFDRENIQRKILLEQVMKMDRKKLEKYELGTRTAMVTFALLLLAPGKTSALKRVLDDLLPNDTDVWCTWKEEVLERIEAGFRHNDPPSFSFNFSLAPLQPDSKLSSESQKLLRALRSDAEAAATVYGVYRTGRPTIGVPLDSKGTATFRPDSTQYRQGSGGPWGSLGRSSPYTQLSSTSSTDTLAYR
ncbi:hypothetical protein C2E23DRAFT_291170 [Lenzites betulinus]|nr:hypothetical protein C2E23DRAFT_291170 [Lenzites betulinus]